METFVLIKRKNNYKVIDYSKTLDFSITWLSIEDFSIINETVCYFNKKGYSKRCEIIAIDCMFKNRLIYFFQSSY